PEAARGRDLPPPVTADAPPLVVFTTGEDTLTRRMCLDLVTAYDDNGLLCEFHLFQKGPHGYSLANPTSANGSSQVLSPHVEKWLDMSVEWLFSVFGEPEFRDVSTSHIMDAMREFGLELDAGAEVDNA
ncbi:MAG: hypothetical protein LUF68_02850, partial [Clostridiales bacterium]|nr:hypothetical protein [Clostridiales bacterium]